MVFAWFVLLCCLDRSLSARFGIMYEGWHGPAVSSFFPGKSQLTVERVLRSNATMKDMHAGFDMAKAWSFHFHKEPLAGFYCIYRKRENETKGAIPDCVGIEETCARHAKMFNDAGISFVVADSTNFQMSSGQADAIQLRPAEVLFEEWSRLRSVGGKTPQIAVWQNINDPKGTLWRQFVDGVYSNETYRSQDLIFRDVHTGKRVFFVVGTNPDPGIMHELESTYGLAVVRMWAEFPKSGFDNGEWAFFSPCVDDGKFTTSIPNLDAKACGQYTTSKSPLGAHGTAITVGPSYQLSYASLPFQGADKYFGLTLKQQFRAVFESTQTLDYVFIGTFNEHIAQPQKNPYLSRLPSAVSMGMETDPYAPSLWVDMYGDGISRDLEPTVEDQGYMWNLLLSCLETTNKGGCTHNPGAACCNASDALHRFTNVWSLATNDKQGHVLTTDAHEREVLLKNGWVEICSPFGGATAFCDSGVTEDTYPRGPFVVHERLVDSPIPWQSSTSPVYRCLASSGQHFVSASPACRGAKMESLLGYAADGPSSHMPRALRQCEAEGRFYHSLDDECSHATVVEVLGFVR